MGAESLCGAFSFCAGKFSPGSHGNGAQATVFWQRFVEMAEDVRHTPLYRDIYKLRQQKIERVFADAKEKHGMRYTQYRGLAQVTNWVKLKFAAMNLKKLATWKRKRKNPSLGKKRRGISSMDFLSALIFFPFEMKKSVWA